MNTIDLNYRPDTYWPESLTPEQLLSRIHGKERQDIARLTYAACGFSGLDAFLAREALTHEEREAWGRVHPLCMGGEYLPDTEAGEVEIARLSMQSTTGDQISMRARQADGVIRYRVVGEYEDEEGMRYVLPFETREQPLSLSELMEFIDGAYMPGCPCRGAFSNDDRASRPHRHRRNNHRPEVVGCGIVCFLPSTQRYNRLSSRGGHE